MDQGVRSLRASTLANGGDCGAGNAHALRSLRLTQALKINEAKNLELIDGQREVITAHQAIGREAEVLGLDPNAPDLLMTSRHILQLHS